MEHQPAVIDPPVRLAIFESEDSEGGHWKSKSRKAIDASTNENRILPALWTCEERNPFTPQIRHFSLSRTRMPSHVKTYMDSGDHG
ncbi:hypothetical protein Tco_0456062 [Tanacetum coccineum]